MVSSLPRGEKRSEGPEDVTDRRSQTYVDAEPNFSATASSSFLWLLDPLFIVRLPFARVLPDHLFFPSHVITPTTTPSISLSISAS